MLHVLGLFKILEFCSQFLCVVVFASLVKMVVNGCGSEKNG